MKLKNIICGLCLLPVLVYINPSSLFAQAFNDVNHTRLKLTKYEDVDGTPFLVDTWQPGNVKMLNGGFYNNLLLKYNQEEDLLYFRGKDDDEILGFVDSVNEFNIIYGQNGSNNTAHYRNGYKDIVGFTPNSFFQVLVDGKAQFLKKTAKSIEEHKEYGSSTSIKKIVTVNKYYFFDKDGIKQIKLGNKSVLSVLNNPQLEAYTNKNNLNLKNESDVIKLIDYYNTI